MKQNTRVTFEERVKNAPTIEFIMNKILLQDPPEAASKRKFSTLIHKSANKFNSFISEKSYSPSSFLNNKCDSVPEILDSIQKKERQIRKVLNSSISRNNSQSLKADSSLSFNLNQHSGQRSSNHFFESPHKSLSPNKKLLSPSKSSKHYTEDYFVTSPDKKKNSYILNKLISPSQNTKHHTDDYFLSNPDMDKNNPINHFKLRLLASVKHKTTPPGLAKAERLKETNLIQKQLIEYKESNYRSLLRENYTIYDSYSESEEEECNSNVIMPQSTFLFIWNIVILLSILYYILIMPYCIAFLAAGQVFTKVIEVFTEMMYVIDVFIQFFIPVFRDTSQDKYNYNLKEIAINYLLGWFVFDFFVSFPYCAIINFTILNPNDTAYLNNAIQLIKIIKILKVLKFFFHSNDKVTHSLSAIDYILPIKRKRLIEFFFYFLVFNHTLSCLWAFMGTLAYPNWIVRQNLQGSFNIDIYFSSFYYTLASIYTIGYGDIYPTNSYERYYNIALQSIGLFLYSYVISSMTSVLKKSQKEVEFNETLNLLETVKIEYKISCKLYTKIKQYLQHSYKVNQSERVNFLQTLPNSLKYALISCIYADFLQFKVFNNTNFDFKARIALSVKPVLYSQREFVLKKGSFIEEAIFIKKGVLSIECQYKSHLLHISKLRRGDQYGEIDMLLDNPSEFDLVIKSKYAELLLLSKEEVIDIGNEYPTFFSRLKKKALTNYTAFMQIEKQKMREIDLSIFGLNKEVNKNLSGFEIEEDRNSFYNKNLLSNHLQDIEEDQNENDQESNDLSTHQIENDLHRTITLKKKSKMDINTTEGRSRLASMNESRLHYIENSPRPHSSVKSCLKKPNPSKTYSRKVTMSPRRSKCETQQLKTAQKGEIDDAKGRGEILPKRKMSSVSINFETVNNLRSMKLKSTKIVRKMREGSMTINDPSKFYGGIFDKWQIDNQLKRIECVYRNVSRLKTLKPNFSTQIMKKDDDISVNSLYK